MAGGNGLRGGVAGRMVVYSPRSTTPYTAPAVLCLGAGCTDHTAIPHTYAHSDKRSETLEVRGALWDSRAKGASKRNRRAALQLNMSACRPMPHPNDPVKFHGCHPPHITTISSHAGEIFQAWEREVGGCPSAP